MNTILVVRGLPGFIIARGLQTKDVAIVSEDGSNEGRGDLQLKNAKP